jgi:hypothetical protein
MAETNLIKKRELSDLADEIDSMATRIEVLMGVVIEECQDVGREREQTLAFVARDYAESIAKAAENIGFALRRRSLSAVPKTA